MFKLPFTSYTIFYILICGILKMSKKTARIKYKFFYEKYRIPGKDPGTDYNKSGYPNYQSSEYDQAIEKNHQPNLFTYYFKDERCFLF